MSEQQEQPKSEIANLTSPVPTRDLPPALKAGWRDEYDWQEAFGYARNIRTATECAPDAFGIDDVASVITASLGQNDEESWLMVGTLKDGRFFFLEAWCDYTGWDCQAGGDAQVAGTFELLSRYGMTESARERLAMPLPPEAEPVEGSSTPVRPTDEKEVLPSSSESSESALEKAGAKP